jgi:hypothetical protein
MFSVSCVEQFPSGHGDFFFWFVLQVSLSAQLSFVAESEVRLFFNLNNNIIT